MMRDDEEQSSYRKRLKALIASQGAAYGFTLTIWSSGMLAREAYGSFSIAHVFLFVLGPLMMYALLLTILYRPWQSPVQLSELQYTPFGFMDFLSVPCAVAVAFFIFSIIHHPFVGIPLGSFLATLVYNLLLAMQLFFFRRLP